MSLEIIRKVRSDEINLLCELDCKIFKNDCFDRPELWEGLETYFITVDLKIVGALAFRHHSDVADSIDADYPYLQNSLYLVSIGILPKKQAKGTGSKAMAWLVDYAREHGFYRIVSNARKSNIASLRLHQRLGFKTIYTIPGYYENPDENATVFEFKL